MSDDEICRLLNDLDLGFGVFEALPRNLGGTLFLSRDPRCPRVQVQVTARADHPDQIGAALEDAGRLLTEGGGGDVVIRHDPNNLDQIVAVRENITPETNWRRPVPGSD